MTFLPADLALTPDYTEALAAVGIRAPQHVKWGDVGSAVADLAPQVDLLWVYRADVAEPLVALCRSVAPSTRILFHPVDLHFLRMERGAAVLGDAEMAQEAALARNREIALARAADTTVVASPIEAEILSDLAPNARIRQVPLARRGPKHAAAGFDQRSDIAFIGGFAHTPNLDAIAWFVKDVWPLVREGGFRDRLVIAGSEMPDEIRSLARPGVEIRGRIETIDEIFDHCRLSIAPLRYGAGLKGKVISSLSYGVPVVATSIAAEGLEEHDGVRVANEPESLAQAILSLYDDEILWSRASAEALRVFRDTFSTEAVRTRILDVVNEVFL